MATKFLEIFARNGKILPSAVAISLPAEGTTRLGATERQNDIGETKTMLRFIGAGLNDLALKHSQ